MKCLLSAVLLAASCLPASAQSSVWKVTRGDSALYLGGTSHVLRPQDFPLPPEFDHAFAAADAVYFETDIRRLLSPEMSRVLMSRGLFDDGRTLESVLSPEAWRAVSAYLVRNRLRPEKFQSTRPWLCAVTIAMLELQKLGVTAEGVDVRLFRAAVDAGKRIGQLESFERHVEAMTGIAEGRESETILSTLDDLETLPEKFPAVLAAWRRGDVARIDELLLRETREKYPELHEALLTRRNREWLPVIEGLLATRETELVLAGAAHFVGDDGLLALLRERGCTIEQVDVTP